MTLTRLATHARRFPCKLMLGTVLACLGVGEWYPFSNYPMFASIGPESWYVHVTDANDRPLATQSRFGVSTGVLRRMYRARCQAGRGHGEDGAPVMPDAVAGREILEFLLRNRRPMEPLDDRSGLRLWHTVVSQADGRVVRQARLVAEIGAP